MLAVEPKRVSWLDTLRGLAVLSVFALHLMLDVKRQIEKSSAVPAWFHVVEFITFGPVDLGKIGVAIFFLISGYLVPVTLNKHNDNAISNFALNRAFRLYPTYWASILVFLVLAETSLSGAQVAINFTMVQRFFGVPDLNGVFWTLQIEIVFYALCVGLKFIGKLENLRLVLWVIFSLGLVAVVMAGARYGTAIKFPVALFIALQLMFLGYFYRLGKSAQTDTLRGLAAPASVVVITLLLACPLAYSRDYGLGEDWRRYLVSYLLAAVIFFACSLRALHLSALSFLGEISYSFYLLHAIIIAWLVRFIDFGQSPERFIIFGGICLIVCVACSWLSFRFIEVPGIEAGRRCIRWLEHRRH